jgi:hypothetical protein
MMCNTEYGSLIIPGSEIPNWFRHQAIGSLISFRVPSFFNGKIGKVLLCVNVVYAANKEASRDLYQDDNWFQFGWRFCNKTRNSQKYFQIEARNRCSFDIFEDHIFIDVMKFDKIELEMKSEDEIELLVVVVLPTMFAHIFKDQAHQSELKKGSIQVKKCGIHLLVDEKNL